MAILQVPLAIFLPSTLIAFTKLRFWQSFGRAQHVETLIGSKATTSIAILFTSFYFQFCKKKTWKFTTHKWPFYDHFGPFFCNFINIFHKNEIHVVILRCLVSQNLLVESKTTTQYQIRKIVSCLQMHHFRANLPKWFLTPPKEISSHIFKMAIFPKFYETFMCHIIR